MFNSPQKFIGLALLLSPLASYGAVDGDSLPAESSVEKAAARVASEKAVMMEVLRELSFWKDRATRVGVPPESFERRHLNVGSGDARVISVVAEDRVIIVSIGRSRGAVQGAVVSIGDKVIGKVLESREFVAAAVLDKSFSGSIQGLNGALATVSVNPFRS